MDSALTEKGQLQAAALRDWLIARDEQADALYASTMRRAHETAHYIHEALGLDIQVDDRIREIGNSALDGRALPETDLPRVFNMNKPDKAPFAHRGLDIDNGESWMHFRTRIGQFMDDLARQHQRQRVYVVAHGGVISAMFDNVFNVGPYRQARTHSHNTGWSRFVHQRTSGRETWQVRFHNRIDHLIEKDLL